MASAEEDVDRAHSHTMRNRREVTASELCGCFYCLRTFAPAEIRDWLRDGPAEADGTAMCPHCGIDSVLGSASGFPITTDFLRRMRARWFNAPPGDEHLRPLSDRDRDLLLSLMDNPPEPTPALLRAMERHRDRHGGAAGDNPPEAKE